MEDIKRPLVKEYAACIGFFLLAAIALSVATFDASDSTSFTLSSKARFLQEPQNLFGQIGAEIGEWCLQLFGAGSIIFAWVFCAQVLVTFQSKHEPSRFWLKVFGYPQLALCYLGLLYRIAPNWSLHGVEFMGGGYVGYRVATAFEMLMGNRGAIIAMIFGVVASLPLCLGLKPLSLLLNGLKRTPFLSTLMAKPAIHAALAEGLNDASEPEKVAPPLVEFPVVRAPEKRTKNVNLGLSAAFEAIKTSFTPAPQSAAMSDRFDELLDLLDKSTEQNSQTQGESERLESEARLLEEKLSTFGVSGKVLHSQPGPVVNVHEFEPAPGIKVTKVLSLQDDLALGLKAQNVFMAPQPGKSTIGIEIPSTKRLTIRAREIFESQAFRGAGHQLPIALGTKVDRTPLVADLASMPHLLVAGSTGSGKSVGINLMLMSLLMTRSPEELRLILVDPKMLELSNYDNIGHLLMPVVTEPQKAAAALKWAIDEMEKRYKLMKCLQVRNLASYNAAVKDQARQNQELKDIEATPSPLPYLVIVIDELCDLMMTAPKDVEDSIQRLAQKARAAGIHLILATQRPSVDVITGVIKANLPCRISYQVASKYDSRTIIESIGAERLLGKGDMLYLPPGTSQLVRAHGAYVSDAEINNVADRLRQFYPANYETSVMERVETASREMNQAKSSDAPIDGNTLDENRLYDVAVDFALEQGVVSTSLLQRQYRIGYNRAARLMDRMAKEGLVGPSEAAGKPRPVICAKGN